jgi:hypothetical protein
VPKPATDLHSRIKPAHTLDLRPSAPVQQAVAHTTNHQPAAPPKSTVHERNMARFNDRFHHARGYERSPHVSRFGQPDPHKLFDKNGRPTLHALEHPQEVTAFHNQLETSTHSPAAAPAPEHHQVMATTRPAPQMPHAVATQHTAMARLVQPATPPAKPVRSLMTSRFLTTAAAIAIMAGYVWLHNYPKLALQSAGARAGVSASLPGYIPSSYNLSRTDTNPGLVTLHFTSPSAPEPLVIKQHRTTWDTSSLLDNYVTKQADSYSTVQEQGLTIYVYGANKATWVNHGIWFSIDGSQRLSRDQILKMAYSL